GASTVAAGGTISFTVANGPGNARDWVTFYCPASTADNGYLDWAYLNNTKVPPASGVTSATVTFTAPTTVGQTCNARLMVNDGLGRGVRCGGATGRREADEDGGVVGAAAGGESGDRGRERRDAHDDGVHRDAGRRHVRRQDADGVEGTDGDRKRVGDSGGGDD